MATEDDIEAEGIYSRNHITYRFHVSISIYWHVSYHTRDERRDLKYGHNG